MRSTNDFTWKVLLEWATTSDPTSFPGTLSLSNEGTNNTYKAIHTVGVII